MNDNQLVQHMARYLKLVSIVLLATSLLACASSNNMTKQDLGTAIGGAAGAILGKVWGGKNEARGMFIGAMLGGALGNWVGARLDDRDAKALEQKTVQALNSASVGETVVWQSDHSGASAEITPISDTVKEKRVDFEIQSVSGVRKTVSALNVREGPGVNFAKKLTLKKGDVVTLHDRANNGWYRVGKDGNVLGFVSGKYLTSISQESGFSLAKKSGEVRYGSNDAASMPEKQQPKRAYSQEASAIVAVRCRTVRVKTKINGKISQKQVETCQGSNGSWGA